MTTRRLAVFAVVFAALSLPAVASAKGPTPDQLVVDGDLVRARGAVIAALGEELSAEDRAANLELLVVIERWSTAGARPRAARAANEAPIAQGDDWPSSFAAAREGLIAGHYAAAEMRLVALSQSAPDPTARARAEKLAMLAHDVKAHDVLPAPALPRAQKDAADSDESKEVKREWYGWETLICDGASVVTSPFVIGIAGYVLCAPIVHLANGEGVKALASVGLRLGAPITLALAGGALDAGMNEGRCEFGCGLGGAIVGGGIGIISAIVVDSAVLARKDAKPSAEKRAAIVPIGSTRGNGIEVGLAGTF